MLFRIFNSSKTENGPKTVKMFLNQSRTLDFESAEHMEPVQELQ